MYGKPLDMRSKDRENEIHMSSCIKEKGVGSETPKEKGSNSHRNMKWVNVW